MVVISHGCKQPYIHFLNWLKGEKAAYRERVLQYRSRSTDYLGPCPLSKFICTDAARIRSEISDLISDEAYNGRWSRVWQLLRDDPLRQGEAVTLIVSAVLRGAGSWEYRFTSMLNKAPLYLLYLLEAPFNVYDEQRQGIAELFIREEKCCLESDPHTDFSWKLRATFRVLFQRVAATGLVDPHIFNVLLLWRARLCAHTQHVEGFISVLQRMTKDCRHLDAALANARVSIKLGYALDANQACEVHRAVQRRVATGAEAGRFVPVPALRGRPPVVRPCKHKWIPPTLAAH